MSGIYLYHYEDYANTMALYEEFENGCDEIRRKVFAQYPNWNIYDEEEDAAEDDFKEKKLEFAKSLGLIHNYGEFFRAPYETMISIPSAKHPNHPFKVGKIEWKNTEDSIENEVEYLIGKSPMRYIFGCEELKLRCGTGATQPDWHACLGRTVEIMRLFDAAVKDGSFRVWTYVPRQNLESLNPPRSSRQALCIFNEERIRPTGDFVSNHYGHFFWAIRSECSWNHVGSNGERPAVHLYSL